MALDHDSGLLRCSPELRAAVSESADVFSDQQLPDYHEGVEKSATKPQPDLNTAAGSYWKRTVTMSDGATHEEYIGISSKPVAETLTVSVPAWWTSPRRGFNKQTADKIMQRGHHVIIKGITVNKLVTLSRMAYDLHASLDHHSEDFGWHFDTTVIKVHGDSNGAMQGTGILGYAPQFHRRVERAYLVDPCIVHRPSPSDAVKFLRHPSYLPKEIISLARQAIRIAADPDERAINHLGTIDPSIHYVVGNLLLTLALFNGEFGTLARNIPAGQRAHYVLFNHSLANHKRELIQILDDRPDNLVTYETRTGTHLSIANPRTVKNKVITITSPSEPPDLRVVTV